MTGSAEAAAAAEEQAPLRRRPGWLRAYWRSVPTVLRGVRSPLAVVRVAFGRTNRPVAVRFAGGIALEVRTALELWVAAATVLGREYEPPGIELGPSATVLDLGASIGDFSVAVAHRGPARAVHAFEPEREAFDLLTRNLRANDADNVVAHRVAVADRDGAAELAVDRRRPVLNAIDPAPTDDRPRVRVPCRRLDGLMDELGIAVCDLLKIDCEGAEPAILAGAGTDGLSRIRAVSLEYHRDSDRRWLETRLGEHGFSVWHAPCRVWLGHGLLFATRDAAR